MNPTRRTDRINGWWEGKKANLLTRSLKYKLQEARTFWWTSNSLPSTIIFRSVNSFSLRCWFNSFNISVEQRRNRQCQTRVKNSEFSFMAQQISDSCKNHHIGAKQKHREENSNATIYGQYWKKQTMHVWACGMKMWKSSLTTYFTVYIGGIVFQIFSVPWKPENWNWLTYNGRYQCVKYLVLGAKFKNAFSAQTTPTCIGLISYSAGYWGYFNNSLYSL